MGAEYWLELEPGEIKKVKEWYKRFNDESNPFSVIIDPPRNKDKISSWIWVEFRNNIVELGYSFGGEGCNRDVALAIGAELMKHVKVRRWGWDGVGWLTPAQMEADGIPRPFESDIRRRITFAAESPRKGRAAAKLFGPISRLEDNQRQLETWAAQLLKDHPINPPKDGVPP